MSENTRPSTVMTATSRAEATWEGDLTTGRGTVRPASGAFSELPVSWAKRTDRSGGGTTSPEELLAAAHSACFSMAFSNVLSKASHRPDQLSTSAEFDFVPGTGITEVRLLVRGRVRGIDAAEFVRLANDAKENCPVSKALSSSVRIKLEATLES